MLRSFLFLLQLFLCHLEHYLSGMVFHITLDDFLLQLCDLRNQFLVLILQILDSFLQTWELLLFVLLNFSFLHLCLSFLKKLSVLCFLRWESLLKVFELVLKLGNCLLGLDLDLGKAGSFLSFCLDLNLQGTYLLRLGVLFTLILWLRLLHLLLKSFHLFLELRVYFFHLTGECRSKFKLISFFLDLN